MGNALSNSFRLVRAGLTLARHGALLSPEQQAQLPWAAGKVLAIVQLGKREAGSQDSRISSALAALGPSYIKLGQFLSTRPDMIGATRAFELKALQDRLPPFSMREAQTIIRTEFGKPVEQLFASFSPPIAAASVAQVHKAVTQDGRTVAVKILRPGVEKRFAADIDSFAFAARHMERLSAEGRRLRPVAAVSMLEQSMKLELDLRMEAAAISEMAGNSKDDPGFRVPKVDWATTSKRVLTTEWIDGVPLADIETLKARGFDLIALGDRVIQSFLRHAIRDGFFHADMHQGNLMVDGAGNLVALDLGIMGRIGPKESLFLAEILHGFIVRDYARVAQVHFEAGYVPTRHKVEDFAQALRAIGEPILGLPAEQISMARLLTQLFEVTEQFDMQTQPQLLLLQKTMVVVEGVARTLNPNLNMWLTAEPVVKDWLTRKLGPLGKLEEMGSSGRALLNAGLKLPEILQEGEKAVKALADLADDPESYLNRSQQFALNGLQTAGLLAGAGALIVIAWQMVAA
jgi:ubiquinone biosynthesis protein